MLIGGIVHSNLQPKWKHCWPHSVNFKHNKQFSIKQCLSCEEHLTNTRKEDFIKKTKNNTFGPSYLGSKSGRNPEIKNAFFPTTTKRTTSGRSNLIGTRVEDIMIVTKKSPAKDGECGVCFLNYYSAIYMGGKNVTGCAARNILVPWATRWCERQDAVLLW